MGIYNSRPSASSDIQYHEELLVKGKECVLYSYEIPSMLNVATDTTEK